MVYEHDAQKREDIKSLCKAIKMIFDERIKKGEIKITRDKDGTRVIEIR